MDELENDISVYTPGSFLSRIWRSILINDGYINNIRALTNAYIDRMRKELETSNTKLMISRSNVYGKVTAQEMTWKNLVLVMKNILRIRDSEITLTTYKKDKVVEYKVNGLTNETMSKLWKVIREDYSDSDISNLVDTYLVRMKDSAGVDTRANVMKKVNSQSRVTWNTVIFLLDEILYLDKIVFNIKIEMKPNLFSTHRLEYYLKDLK